MSEWFKVPVLKTGMLFKVSGVRILPHPYELECYAVLAFSKLLLFATCLVQSNKDIYVTLSLLKLSFALIAWQTKFVPLKSNTGRFQIGLLGTTNLRSKREKNLRTRQVAKHNATNLLFCLCHGLKGADVARGSTTCCLAYNKQSNKL